MRRLVLLLAPAIFVSAAAFPSDDFPTHGEMKDMEAYVRMLTEGKILIVFDPGKNYASVNPAMWRAMKANEKEAVIGTLAMYCEGLRTGAARVPIGRGSIEIKDAATGAPLARFDNGKLVMDEQPQPY